MRTNAALPQVGRDLAGLIKGKVVVDACNPIVARDGEMAIAAREKGAGLASAELLPGARIVRAFNAIGYARLPAIAQRQGERTAMPMAGDDANAIAVASRLVRDIGFEPVVIGPLAMVQVSDPGNAACRRAYARKDPANSRHPELSRSTESWPVSFVLKRSIRITYAAL